jgi:hypothetical protein
LPGISKTFWRRFTSALTRTCSRRTYFLARNGAQCRLLPHRMFEIFEPKPGSRCGIEQRRRSLSQQGAFAGATAICREILARRIFAMRAALLRVNCQGTPGDDGCRNHPIGDHNCCGRRTASLRRGLPDPTYFTTRRTRSPTGYSRESILNCLDRVAYCAAATTTVTSGVFDSGMRILSRNSPGRWFSLSVQMASRPVKSAAAVATGSCAAVLTMFAALSPFHVERSASGLFALASLWCDNFC